MTDSNIASSSQQTSISPDLSRFLAERYPLVKAQYPGQGRRKWRLLVAEQFWALPPIEKAAYAQTGPIPTADAENEAFATDDDPLDSVTVEASGLGIVLRTDFSNDQAWHAFCDKLQQAEAEFAADSNASIDENTPTTQTPQHEAMDEDESEEGEEDGDEPSPVFYVLDPEPIHRPAFTAISNITALRVLNDVDIRPAPPLPSSMKRIKPSNRLVDHDGWQETYTGKMVWIYDTKSNTDQCVRLVSQQGAMYGTATADSWRARVSHICELQVNLASGVMSIDFGGLDRWDYPERVRNMEDAIKPIAYHTCTSQGISL